MTGISRKSDSLTARTLWLMFAKTLTFGFGFMLPLLLVRQFDQYEFGLYKQAFLIVVTAWQIFSLGFGLSAYYFLPREPERRGQIVFNVVLVYAFLGTLAGLIFTLWPSLLAAIFNGPEMVPYATLLGVVVLFWTISSFLEHVVVANQETTLAPVVIISTQLARMLLLLGAAVVFGSLEALLYAAALHGVLQTIGMLYYLRWRFGRFWRDFDGRLMIAQLSYALPLGLAGTLYVIYADVHNYFVSNRFGAAMYAVYAVGCFQLPLIGILTESVASVMLARVSHLQNQNEHREILLLTVRMMRKLAVVYFPLHAFLLVVGREFIAVLFTAQYLASWPVFAINLTLIPLYIISTACDPVIRSYAEYRYFFLKTRVALLGLLLLALWLGTKYFGLVGMITIVVGVSLIERLVLAFKVGRILDVGWRDAWLLKDMGKLAAAAITAGVVAAAARSLLSAAAPLTVLAACGVVFSLVYLTAVLLLGVLTADERDLVRRQAMRLSPLFPWQAKGTEQ